MTPSYCNDCALHMLAPSFIINVNIQLFWSDDYISGSQERHEVKKVKKDMRSLLAGEYVLVHTCGKILLAIFRDERSASSCICTGGYDKVGER